MTKSRTLVTLLAAAEGVEKRKLSVIVHGNAKYYTSFERCFHFVCFFQN